ncbi:MAG: flagellar assembly protein A [Spirochaetaceae bacterium]
MAKSEGTISGAISLLIDDDGVEARLRVEPKPNGKTWTTADVVKLLTDRGVREGYDASAVNRKLAEAEKKARTQNEAVDVVAAEGLRPEQPKPERIRLREHPIPEDLKEAAEQKIAGAGPPEIVFERRKRVKRKKSVQRKSRLPFRSPKQETVEVVETQTVSERVYVDPTVEETGYVQEGEKIGDVLPRETGIPGRSIFGEIIHPRVPADPNFYIGKHAVRRGEEVFAEGTGFLRKGSNWLDVVRHRLHDWELSLSDDQATCYFSFNPGDASHSPPTAEDVVAAAEEEGFDADSLIDTEEISELIRHVVETGKPLESVPISTSRDASYDIVVLEEKRKAVLNISKGRGRGKALDLKALGHALRESKLKGMKFEKVKEDIMAFYNGPESDLYGYVLAEGRAPVPGPDREIEFSVRFLADEVVERLKRRAVENPELLAGMKSLAEFPISDVQRAAKVTAEQRLAAVPPEVEGTPGVDVYGATIPAPAGHLPELRLYENIEKKDRVIVARRDGIFEETTDEEAGVIRMRVRPHRDAEIKAEIANDNMQAFLSLFEGEGTGSRLSVDDARRAVEEAGVSYGIDGDAILEAVRHASEEGPVFRAVVARGTEPQSVESRSPQYLVRLASGKGFTVKEDGRVDHKHHDQVTVVTKGTKLMRIPPPPEEPSPGYDVTGAKIEPKKTAGGDIQLGQNVRAEEQADGSTVVVAAVSGELAADRSSIDVRPARTIKGNVGVETGNIKFPGSVYVKGGVDAGYYVFANGDIRITEGVEGCLLSAEGDIILKQGVKGAGKAVLRSKARIQVAFAEQATLLSVGDIHMKSGCMHSTVKCNGTLRFQSDKGSVVGGRVRVRKGLQAQNLGSSRGVATEISFGQDYLIADQIEKAEKEIEQLKLKITKDDMAMREESDDRERLEELRKEKKKLLKMIEQRSVRLFSLREKFEEHYPSELRIRGTVFPGVRIESHGRTMEFTAPEKAVVISFDEQTGRLTRTPISQTDDSEGR